MKKTWVGLIKIKGEFNMKNYLSILLLMNICFISACSTMNSNFDCPNKAGISCKSLDQINGMVDSGQLRGRTQTSLANDTGNMTNEFQSFPVASTFVPGQPIRYGETVQRIWIAPYEDTEGNYHQDNLIYSVIKPGAWIGKPVKTVHSF
jgi:conjugal transfer pilus assembly protein TraV